MDVTALLEQAELHLSELQYEQCGEIYQNILKRDPTNVAALDGIGLLYMELEDMDKAKQAFLESVRVAPMIGHEKYLNLGQLTIGKESVEYYKKGIEVMKGELDKKMRVKGAKTEEEEEDIEELKSSVASAYCAIVEVYMTDEAEEDEAEKICQQALEEAMKYDDQSAEVYQSLASFKISQSRNDEALKHLEHSYSLWSKNAQLLDEDAEPDYDFEQDLALPSYQFRTNTAKYFLELGKPEPASEVLERLVAEDDQCPEVLYLLSVSILRLSQTTPPARHPKEALPTLELAQKLLKEDNTEESREMKEEIESLIKLVNSNDDMQEDDDDPDN
eukprot:TRINITY_DN4705_c0_g1_i1.p1 TRINITY_DN4705_c0_g1~~TRINITY_DN4705_c0_g1_i1.p1  ORF type:complete len:351 (+),score=128.40 TRINITY_DN4705_c0_g1_i1:60-1055(+)